MRENGILLPQVHCEPEWTFSIWSMEVIYFHIYFSVDYDFYFLIRDLDISTSRLTCSLLSLSWLLQDGADDPLRVHVGQGGWSSKDQSENANCSQVILIINNQNQRADLVFISLQYLASNLSFTWVSLAVISSEVFNDAVYKGNPFCFLFDTVVKFFGVAFRTQFFTILKSDIFDAYLGSFSCLDDENSLEKVWIF